MKTFSPEPYINKLTMFKDATLGQFYPADSILHRLDPRVKLLGCLVYIIMLFSFKGLPGFILVTAFLVLIIVLCKVPFSFMVKGIRGIMILIIIAAVFNIFFTPGDVIWQWKAIKITDTGLRNAVLMTIRMFYLIVGTSIMTLTTTPNQLTDGMEKQFAPLEKINVPVHDVAMMMSIALRFIPILTEETNKIMNAQKSRGADFETGNVFQRAKAMVPILVPLFVNAFRRANDLALAMEARCYAGGVGRTKMHLLKYQTRDFIAYIILFAFLVGVFVLKHFFKYMILGM